METIYERVGALDVHKAQVTACVRVPEASGRREPASGGVLNDGHWPDSVARLAGGLSRDARRDGSDGRVLAAGVARPGGRL